MTSFTKAAIYSTFSKDAFSTLIIISYSSSIKSDWERYPYKFLFLAFREAQITKKSYCLFPWHLLVADKFLASVKCSSTR